MKNLEILKMYVRIKVEGSQMTELVLSCPRYTRNLMQTTLPGSSTNYANNLARVLHQLCKQPCPDSPPNYANTLFFSLSLFGGMFVSHLLVFLLRPKCALVLGNGCERLCASRPLLGSYVHQESIQINVNNTNVFRCVLIESLLFYFCCSFQSCDTKVMLVTKCSF